ncbi:MAG: D-alanine--D-alanine ligase [Clostridia bacterium]|nr:D-alanine--D-alanine ligase [Clostridia bacterium]
MKKVLVVFGGASSEHSVSTVSASSVIKHISKEEYEVFMLGITINGEWMLFEGDPNDLPEDKWIKSEKCKPAFISPDSNVHGIVILENEKYRTQYIDVVFPVLHGKNGEDGTIQGLLQLSGIPFVGCDAASSAICMDKALTNTMADANGIAQAKWASLLKTNCTDNELQNIANKLGYPIFVKPANAGSSVGINKAKDFASLKEAAQKAFFHDEKVVFEEFIQGVEIECAVLGNSEPVAAVLGEVTPCNEFYDFDAKYINGTSKLSIPARLEMSVQNNVKQEALRTFKALGCSGISRVDFFVCGSGEKILFNEINTIPGFTSISMYPKMFEASGIEYSQLIDKILNLAIEKWSE